MLTVYGFLGHLSWKLKWVSDLPPSVRLSVRPFVNFSVVRTTKPISTKLGTKHPWVKGIQVFQMIGHTLFKGEIITK